VQAEIGTRFAVSSPFCSSPDRHVSRSSWPAGKLSRHRGAQAAAVAFRQDHLAFLDQADPKEPDTSCKRHPSADWHPTQASGDRLSAGHHRLPTSQAGPAAPRPGSTPPDLPVRPPATPVPAPRPPTRLRHPTFSLGLSASSPLQVVPGLTDCGCMSFVKSIGPRWSARILTSYPSGDERPSPPSCRSRAVKLREDHE
jgi:hypothetical protein